MDEDLLGFWSKVAVYAGLNLEEVLDYVLEGFLRRVLVFVTANPDAGTYHLQNLQSSEPFWRLVVQVIVQMAAILLIGDILLAQSAQFVQQV